MVANDASAASENPLIALPCSTNNQGWTDRSGGSLLQRRDGL